MRVGPERVAAGIRSVCRLHWGQGHASLPSTSAACSRFGGGEVANNNDNIYSPGQVTMTHGG